MKVFAGESKRLQNGEFETCPGWVATLDASVDFTQMIP
jgi:hypothetical protein